MSNKITIKIGGIDISIIGIILGIVFIVLKILNYIQWSWIWVLCPFWIVGIVSILLLIISVIVSLIVYKIF